MDEAFHYPPELLALLVDAIPRLVRSKKDVLLFFRGAGVSDLLASDVRKRLETDADGISKYEIARLLLTRINESGDKHLQQRREVLKRVTEYEDFSTCWPNDQLIAKGYVGEIRKLVNVKDAFTRMNIERKKEEEAHRAAARTRQEILEKRRTSLASIRQDLGTATAEANPQKRGSLLEAVTNRLFTEYGIGVRESFRVRSDKGEGVLEQIDGVIELDGHLYLVEMKWLKGPVGKADLSEHLMRIYHRGQARGFFISASGYSPAAVDTAREALQHTVFALAEVEEIVLLLERELDLVHWLREKLRIAQLDKQPRVRVNLDKIKGLSA